MDYSLNYSSILQKTLREATIAQPRLQSIQVYPVCDVESGHFLVLATGWDRQEWIHTILFHAFLADDRITIQEDNFEEGLTSALVAAGIPADHVRMSSMP